MKSALPLVKLVLTKLRDIALFLILVALFVLAVITISAPGQTQVAVQFAYFTLHGMLQRVLAWIGNSRKSAKRCRSGKRSTTKKRSSNKGRVLSGDKPSSTKRQKQVR